MEYGEGDIPLPRSRGWLGPESGFRSLTVWLRGLQSAHDAVLPPCEVNFSYEASFLMN